MQQPLLETGVGTPTDPKPKTKWQVKREASYEALVIAAMRAFQERGFAATTVKDIVADTGYSPGAFYFHFADKSDCFWHVIAFAERLRGDWSEVVREADARVPLEKILRRIFALFDERLKGVTAWVTVMVDFALQHRDDPEVAVRLAEIYQRWRGEIVRFVVALQEGDWVGRERDPVFVATQLFALGEGMLVHRSMYGGALDQETMAAARIDGLARILRG